MASQNPEQEQQNTIEALDQNLKNMSRQVATNTKAIYVAFGAIIIIAALTLGYIYLIHRPNQEKSYEALNKVEIEALGNDSVAAAQYTKVAQDYSGSKAGNLALLGAAEANYNLGKYKEAAAQLEKFSSKDKVLGSNAKTLLGDCYVQLKQYPQAIEAYNHALKTCDGNPQIAPRILLKEANVYDEQKNYAKALDCYENIQKNYPQFSLGNNMSLDAYIEREKARLGK